MNSYIKANNIINDNLVTFIFKIKLTIKLKQFQNMEEAKRCRR